MNKLQSIPVLLMLLFVTGLTNCKKSSTTPPPTPPVANMVLNALTLNGRVPSVKNYNTSVQPQILYKFSAPINTSTISSAISFTEANGTPINFTSTLLQNDSTLIITPTAALRYLTKHTVSLSTALKSKAGASLFAGETVQFVTKIDSSRKYPTITDEALLTLTQQQTFKYFWDFGHPVSGMARERNTSGDLVTSGGTGFGIMAIVTGVSRNFITRTQGLNRLQTITSFLKNTAQRFHGAYPHWLNGNTGAVIAFSTKDNGADLVETSLLLQGLLTARQYFNGADAAETQLRADINTIWNSVEWNWFRKSNENVLYWHWSPTYNWDMNMQIRGWNESLITYVLAASSTAYSIPLSVYTSGWKGAPGFTNGNSYFGYQLPLGPAQGGPLFFSHYSFLGIDPNGLNEGSVNYLTQNTNHAKINNAYCRNNPNLYFGYSDSCWGLTASDINNGYTASSPTNDVGVIAPTAALASFPYTPIESMKALKFYYYVLGDKIWKDYGFVDAFSLQETWFADSFLAIDQGPIIVMIENYRTGLLWNLFTSCPEVKTGMRNLGFTAPYL
ncbi:MAG: glucoamylase family protein [Ferruginibacter sp.]